VEEERELPVCWRILPRAVLGTDCFVDRSTQEFTKERLACQPVVMSRQYDRDIVISFLHICELIVGLKDRTSKQDIMTAFH
jgi:hypothetical protein